MRRLSLPSRAPQDRRAGSGKLMKVREPCSSSPSHVNMMLTGSFAFTSMMASQAFRRTVRTFGIDHPAREDDLLEISHGYPLR